MSQVRFQHNYINTMPRSTVLPEPSTLTMIPNPSKYDQSKQMTSVYTGQNNSDYSSRFPSDETSRKLSLPPISELFRDSPSTPPVTQHFSPTYGYYSSTGGSFEGLHRPEQLGSYPPAPGQGPVHASVSQHQVQHFYPATLSPSHNLGIDHSRQTLPQQQQQQPQQPQQQPYPPTIQKQKSVSQYLPDTSLIVEDKTKPGSRRKRQNLPRQTTLILLNWLSDHLDRPYPNTREKYELLIKTHLTIQQLDNWFINARRRKINILRKMKESDQNISLMF